MIREIIILQWVKFQDDFGYQEQERCGKSNIEIYEVGEELIDDEKTT